MITGVHHVGQVVEDFEAALSLYTDVLGATVFEQRDVTAGDEGNGGTAENGTGNDPGDPNDPAVRMAFTEVPGYQVHLIARERRGTDIDSLLDSLLAVSPYHVAYAVPDMVEAIARTEEADFAMYDTEPVSGLGPYERAFADPESVPGVPFEFVELAD